MTFRLLSPPACLALLIASLWAAPTGSVRVTAQDLGSEAQREAGKALYLKNCSQCHGEKGDGQGYATAHLQPQPRNFTTGKFKVRTTPNGALPTHQDLVNIIRRGMPYTSMPAWPTLTDQEVENLAYFITSFSADFSSKESVPKPVELPSAPSMTNATVEAGKKLYVDNGCVKCHGTLGRADGPSSPTLTDELNRPIRPADLSQPWTFRGGPTREDIFRTMSTGFNGTPMPSFADALTPEQRWAITDFIVSLSGTDGPAYTNLLIARFSPDPIDLARGTASFASAPVARFPIIGQITEPVREFHPPATAVTVQAVYDSDNIAFLVRWHDRTAEKTGKNGPALPVPPEEEETEGGPAGGAGGAGGGASPANPFGDAEVTPTAAAQPPAGAPQDPFADASATTPEAAPSEFSDAVSIQIPSAVPTTARKPYFIFGDSQNSVDLWFFDLARPDPLQFTGKGSADVAPNDTGDVTGVASYDQGEWSVIFKRPIRPTAGAPFTPGEFLPIAFSVWDGASRERGSRRGLTVWESVYLEPEVVPSAAGPMIRIGLVLLLAELAIIAFVRRRYSARAGTEPGSPPPRSGFGEVSPERAR
jgi:mono/diheme cytochrome c family protein